MSTVKPSGALTGAEPADREARTVGREWRQHGMEARAVGEPGVDHRRRAIETQAERRDDPLDDPHDGRGVDLARDALDPARAFDEDTVGAVHHDLGDRRIAEQRFERTEPADVVDQLVEHHVGRRGGKQRRFLAQHPRKSRAELGAVEHCRIEGRVEQTAVQRLPQRGIAARRIVRVGLTKRPRHAACSSPKQPITASA